MVFRTVFFAAVLVASGSAAFAESEGNNLAATEVPGSTGVYFTTPSAAQGPAARVTEVGGMPGVRH